MESNSGNEMDYHLSALSITEMESRRPGDEGQDRVTANARSRDQSVVGLTGAAQTTDAVISEDSVPPSQAQVVGSNSSFVQLLDHTRTALETVRITKAEQDNVDTSRYPFFDLHEPVPSITRILRETQRVGLVYFEVEYNNSKRRLLSIEDIENIPGGLKALETFEASQNKTSESDFSSEESVHHPRRAPIRKARLNQQTSTSDPFSNPRRSTRISEKDVGAKYFLQFADSSEDRSEESDESFTSQPGTLTSRRQRRRNAKSQRKISKPRLNFETTPPPRRSRRKTRHVGNMQDIVGEHVEQSTSTDLSGSPRRVRAEASKEQFVQLPPQHRFKTLHDHHCGACGSNAGDLILCQGCSLAYHQHCLGPRSGRDHLVTKIGEENFVLQCRKCINTHRKKNVHDPDLGKCHQCHQTNPACQTFSQKKTTVQEHQEREANGGVHPVTSVSPFIINNHSNLLFRCPECSRGFHFHHLSAREYDHRRCKECLDKPGSIQLIVAWRPIDHHNLDMRKRCRDLHEDSKEYLVKWKQQSHHHDIWVPAAWVWGVSHRSTLTSFFRKDEVPKTTFKDAVPEDWLRIDIVFDVKFTNPFDAENEEDYKACVNEVEVAYVKYKGLGYEDACWEQPPKDDEGERWNDFMTAYFYWVMGKYLHAPTPDSLQSCIDVARQLNFGVLQKDTQPSILTGGTLMDHQIEGFNWMYYNWHKGQNGILADEMGLGKTIQVVAFIATLIETHQSWPFLIVVPNSTCANWRREFQKWAPSLRVVTYFGSAISKKLSRKYELFPEGSQDLRAHVVVSSYEAFADSEAMRSVFSQVSWAGLIVDEGQRLKSDATQLYSTLLRLKINLRILLTGTPLQNNIRELFNLLHFLDPRIDAEDLEKQYEKMDIDKVQALHALLRPFILHRTKKQVLTELPPLTQIVVPVGMSKLQRKVYKSIINKDENLLQAIFNPNSTKKVQKTNLNSCLVQLRKCLCHPFIYNRDIEERTENPFVAYRNLILASGKLELLERLLPKLQQEGHRVLFFSQFLDMLTIMEDFLIGLGMKYRRLDGLTTSTVKQKHIDKFNADGSEFFAFLLSTRAGGVGINLYTADTVIILDPDFNPHQDMQALSRAHRIGQQKPVLCIQLITKHGVETQILQSGRKKLSLDQVVVQQLRDDNLESEDVATILKAGAAKIFEDKDEALAVKYNDDDIDKLLDRRSSQGSSVDQGPNEPQFSFARVWEVESGQLLDNIEEDGDNDGTRTWSVILKDRERRFAATIQQPQELGKGKRARMEVDYQNTGISKEVLGSDDESGKEVRHDSLDEDDAEFKEPPAEEADDDEDEMLIDTPRSQGRRNLSYSTSSTPSKRSRTNTNSPKTPRKAQAAKAKSLSAIATHFAQLSRNSTNHAPHRPRLPAIRNNIAYDASQTERVREGLLKASGRYDQISRAWPGEPDDDEMPNVQPNAPPGLMSTQERGSGAVPPVWAGSLWPRSDVPAPEFNQAGAEDDQSPPSLE